MIKHIFKLPLTSTKLFISFPIILSTRSVASNQPKPHQVLTQYLPLAPNTIWDNPGSAKRAKRVGRGPGSGKG